MSNGFGEYFQPIVPLEGVGAYYEIAGFGSVADSFSSEQIWVDLQVVNQCFPRTETSPPSGTCNIRSQRVNKAVSAGLNELGYGPIAVDGTINWQGAYQKFLSDFGMTKGPGYGLTKQALTVMEQQLKGGKTPGPNPPLKYDKIDVDTYVPKDKPGSATAGMGNIGMLLGLVVLGGIGFYAYSENKKKKGGVSRGSSKSARGAKTYPR